MQYEVRFVQDSELPSEVDYAFARVDGRTYLFMKRSVVIHGPGECRALTRSFTTWEQSQSVELKELAGAF